MNLYYMSVSPLEDEAFFEKVYNRLPEHRKNKTDSMKFDKDKRLCAGAWILLENIFEKFSLNINDYELKNNEFGKPYFENCKLKFNISHSKNIVAVAVSENEIGVDVECIKKKHDGIADRFFHADEIEYLNSFSCEEYDVEFTKIWTKKEAYIKAIGTGFSTTLKSFSVFDSKSLSGNQIETYTVSENVIISVAYSDGTFGTVEKIELF